MAQEHDSSQSGGHHIWLWICGLWIAALVIGVSRVAALHSTVRVTAAFIGLIAIPGWLTGEILMLRQRWSRVQSLALGLVLGLMEAIILGQIAVLAGVPTLVLIVVIVALGMIKAGWLVRKPLLAGMARQPGTLALWVQLVVLLGAVLWILSAVSAIPDHPQQSYNDAWNYLAVQAQFSANPGNLNLSDGVLISSLNARLRWNPWLYLLAMLTDYSGVHPVTLVDRDIRFTLFVLAILIAIAFARELLGKRALAYSTGLLHLLFLLVSADQFMDMRITEDKYSSLLVLFPVVFMLVVRMLDRPTRYEWWMTTVVLIGVALIHPFNAPAIVVALLAYVVLHTLLNWQSASHRNAAILIGLMLLLVALPVVQQVLISRDPVVAATLEGKSAVDLSYHLPFPTISDWYQADTIYNAGFAVIMLGMFAFVLRDRAALFLVSVVISLVFVMWIPPVSGLFAKVVTPTQAIRIALLMPVGYAWGWAFGKLDDLLLRDKQRQPAVLAALSIVPFVTQLGLWAVSPYPVRISLTYWAFDDALWDALEAGEAIIRDANVLVSPKLSTYAPIFWPDAHYSLRYRATAQFDNDDIMAMFGPDPLVTAQEVTERYGFEYLAIERNFPLDGLIRSAWPCCRIEYENDSVTIARMLYDIPPDGQSVTQPQTPVEAQFGDVATLVGYMLQQESGGIQITLYWQPLQNSDAPLTGFAHLIGPYNPATGGPLWSQDDHQPRLGQMPTTDWVAEDVVADAYWLETDGIPAGDYEIWIGLYDVNSGVRLSVPGGGELDTAVEPADHLVLQSVSISN